MLARQTSDECSPEYRVQPGDPCVPIVADIDCPELRAEDIVIIGDDVYGLDHGGEEGVACESGASTGSPRGDPDGTDPGSFTGPVGVALAVVVGVAAGALLWRRRRGATEHLGRWSIRVAIGGGVVLVALALGLLTWG